MLNLPPTVRIFVARGPTDMRRGFDGLSAEVIDRINEDPQSGHLFLFMNKRRDRIKIAQRQLHLRADDNYTCASVRS